MPIYEYYSPDTHKIYSFYAKTLAQGQTIPKCPDDPKARMEKLISAFAIGGTKREETAENDALPGATGDDARIDAAMEAMEREFAHVDENDPRAMARMMRRMAELSGEKLDEPMEEAVRKLEEGADPDSIESELGDVFGGEANGEDAPPAAAPNDERAAATSRKARFKIRRAAPVRDPKLYDYE